MIPQYQEEAGVPAPCPNFAFSHSQEKYAVHGATTELSLTLKNYSVWSISEWQFLVCFHMGNSAVNCFFLGRYGQHCASHFNKCSLSLKRVTRSIYTLHFSLGLTICVQKLCKL